LLANELYYLCIEFILRFSVNLFCLVENDPFKLAVTISYVAGSYSI